MKKKKKQGKKARKRARKKTNRGTRAGERMAIAIIEWLHLFYQYDTQIRVLRTLLDKLKKHLENLILKRDQEREGKDEKEADKKPRKADG